MECKDCAYLIKTERISLISQIMGYTAECSKTGILFHLDSSMACPLWCPLSEDGEKKKKFLS